MFLMHDDTKFIGLTNNIRFDKKWKIVYFPFFQNHKDHCLLLSIHNIKHEYNNFERYTKAYKSVPYFSFSKFIDKTMNLRRIKFPSQFISLITDSLHVKCYDNYDEFIIARLTTQKEDKFFIDLR